MLRESPITIYGVTVSRTDRDLVPYRAVTVIDVEAVTGTVVTIKVALALPGATVTLAGRLDTAELSLNVTTMPPVGAGPVSVTVPWEVDPPTMVVGLSESVFRSGAVTVSVVVLVKPLYSAEIVTEVFATTGLVVIVNVVLALPAGTVTLAGTPATAVLLLVRDTTAPPLGAAPVSVTVPVEVPPPTTLDGLRETELNVGGVTVSVVVLVTPL